MEHVEDKKIASTKSFLRPRAREAEPAAKVLSQRDKPRPRARF